MQLLISTQVLNIKAHTYIDSNQRREGLNYQLILDQHLFIVRISAASFHPFIHGMAWLPTYAMQVACGLLGGYEIRFRDLGGRRGPETGLLQQTIHPVRYYYQHR